MNPPAQLIFQHPINNGLPTVEKEYNDSQISEYQNKMKLYADTKRRAKQLVFQPGDMVLIKNYHRNNKTKPFYETTPYTIIENHTFSATLQKKVGKIIKCNKSHLKPYKTT